MSTATPTGTRPVAARSPATNEEFAAAFRGFAQRLHTERNECLAAARALVSAVDARDALGALDGPASGACLDRLRDALAAYDQTQAELRAALERLPGR